jgi:Transposase IS4
MAIFDKAKTLVQKYSALKPHLCHLRNNPFPERLFIPKRQPAINLPSTASSDKPESLLNLFLTQDHLKLIAQHTNLYAQRERLTQAAKAKEAGQDLPKARPWQDKTPKEIAAFVGALFLMGCHSKLRPIENYWSESYDKPLFPLRRYISQYSFQQIARYLKINHLNEQVKEEN